MLRGCRALPGGLPDEVPHRYRQGSPTALLPLGVPQRHRVGLWDDVVPPRDMCGNTSSWPGSTTR